MYEDEGYRFMGAAFEVYNQLGYGMAEEVYQQSLELEMMFREIPFVSKAQLEVSYKGHTLQTCFVPDLFVFEAIVVELKAVTELVSDHEAQLFNYMRIASQSVGYLLNFGKRHELQWKRFVLSDLKGRKTEH